MTSAYLYRTFEYIDHIRNDANIEIRITFNWYPGDPGRTYGDPSKCYPATGPEREYVGAEREVDASEVDAGKWVPIADTEWLGEWCIAAFERADDDDLVRALPDNDDRDDECRHPFGPLANRQVAAEG